VILVVVDDPRLRELVGWILDELELRYVALSTWRPAVAELAGRPSLAVVDLDDVGAHLAGLVALLRAGWGEPVPFIGLSRRPDRFAEAGSADVLRTPLNVGLLMGTVTRLVPTS
jgi:DNA-binding response OmpR family regulator